MNDIGRFLLLHDCADLDTGLLRSLAESWIGVSYFYKVCLFTGRMIIVDKIVKKTSNLCSY